MPNNSLKLQILTKYLLITKLYLDANYYSRLKH